MSPYSTQLDKSILSLKPYSLAKCVVYWWILVYFSSYWWKDASLSKAKRARTWYLRNAARRLFSLGREYENLGIRLPLSPRKSALVEGLGVVGKGLAAPYFLLRGNDGLMKTFFKIPKLCLDTCPSRALGNYSLPLGKQASPQLSFCHQTCWFHWK